MYDMVGKTFGVLNVLKRAKPKPEHYGQAAWKCKCECGKTCVVTGRELRVGHTKSCGCKKSAACAIANTTHGAWVGQRTGGKVRGEWRVWAEMKQRCYNPKSNRYYTHGARGIKVCDRWLQSFKAFLEDMGPKPDKRMSLERRDNDKGYEPGNCYWATLVQQARNRRNNRMITANGQTKCVAEWAEITGIKSGTIRTRLKIGWSAEEALTP
jgi:hypothetical protein